MKPRIVRESRAWKDSRAHATLGTNGGEGHEQD